MKQDLEILNNIQKVETPAFLYERIQQKITFEMSSKMPIKWTYAIAASIALLIYINIKVVEKNSSKNNFNLAKSMNLITDNNLYYE